MWPNTTSRRGFLKQTMLGGAAAIGALATGRAASFAAVPGEPTATAVPAARVALTTGRSRAEVAFEALRPLSQDIARAIGNRRVIIKPNNVSTTIPLASTHAETLEGIFEFLKSIGKLDGAAVAESAASGPTMDGYENFGYIRLAEKYGVKLLDLDQQGFEVMHVIDERDMRPKAVRMSSLLLDPASFVISAARMKTHDRVVATLSLKNIVFGAPIKDIGAGWGPSRRPGARNDKPIAHGGGIHGINYNMFALAQHLHPHLALIDGFEGMEGDGPTGGTPVDHRVCVAGLDWLAADRVALELMGIDFAHVGYLNYCAAAGMGQSDLGRIEIIGESIERHRRKYQLARDIEQQLSWMKPPGRA
jgi:uncharacterized protein (DUF362 family)